MTDAHTITVECRSCGATFCVAAIAAGSTENCPVCGTQVQVPRRGGVTHEEDEEVVELVPEDEEDWSGEGSEKDKSPAAGELFFNSRFPENPAAPCLVCLVEEERPNAMTIGPMVHSITGNTRQDVFMLIANGMGIIAETNGTKGRLVAEAMGLQGHQAFVIDAQCVPTLTPVRPKHQVALGADALTLDPAYPRMMLRLAWTDIHAAALATVQIKEETYTPPKIVGVPGRMGVVGLTGGTRSGFEVHRDRKQQEAQQLLFVLARHPEEHRSVLCVSFAAASVNYNCLDASRGESKFTNFRLFCAQVLSHVNRGFVPPSRRTWLSTAKAKLPRLTTRLQIDWHHRWLLCCATALFGPVQGNH